MSFQEKRAIAYLVGTLLVLVGFWILVVQRFQDGSTNPANIFHYWASVILILIPVTVGVRIVVYIPFYIINWIATQEEEPDLIDERDKLIELKAIRHCYYTFMLGFFLSVGTQVFSMPPATMFIGFAITPVITVMVYDLSEIYFYRRGV